MAAMATTVAGAPAADAAQTVQATSSRAGCVDRGEYRAAKKGMSPAKIKRMFGTNGTRDAISQGGGHKVEIRSYRACTRFGAVSLSFTNDKMDDKVAVW